MNRRSFTATAFAVSFLPGIASMKQDDATPQIQPPREVEAIDTRTRDLTTLLETIPPASLLQTLEDAEVTNDALLDMNDGEAPTAVPWADHGDTDLYNSLGGVGLTTGGTNLGDSETEMLGAYIVYESADIAYHEFTRKIGDLYENPSNTMTTAGTTIWIVDSEDFNIGTWRIGNVMMMAMFSDRQGLTVDGIIGHLSDVAMSLSG